MPFLPKSAEMDLIAGRTSHSNGDIPLLGLHFKDAEDTNRSDIDLDRIQNAIDVWFDLQDPDTLDQALADIDFPTWAYLVSVRQFPDRTIGQVIG